MRALGQIVYISIMCKSYKFKEINDVHTLIFSTLASQRPWKVEVRFHHNITKGEVKILSDCTLILQREK